MRSKVEKQSTYHEFYIIQLLSAQTELQSTSLSTTKDQNVQQRIVEFHENPEFSNDFAQRILQNLISYHG